MKTRRLLNRVTACMVALALVLSTITVSQISISAADAEAGTPYDTEGNYDVTVEHVVINQVYGGSDDGYASHSFIELYNPTDSDIDLSGWELTYMSSSSGDNADAWEELTLTGTIPANGYYLIRCAAVTDDSNVSYEVSEGDQQWNIAIHNKGVSVALFCHDVTLDDTFLGEVTDDNRPDGYVDLLAVQGNDSTDAQIPPVYEGAYSDIQSKKNGITRTDYVDTDDNSADLTTVNYSKSVSADSAPHTSGIEQESTADITILYTNDVHSYIDEDIKYSAVAKYEETIESMDATENVLLVDAGDHIQGTAYGGMDEGATVIQLMNAAGYDLATLGNHEFDYDMDRLMEVIDEADYNYVSSNFYSIGEDDAEETVLDSYQVFEIDGTKVALIGITTPESITKSTPAYFQDDDGNYIYGIYGGSDGTDLYNAVQAAIDEASEEADIVIALGHLGVDESSSPWTSYDVIENTTGLDAFIDGHSHTTMESEIVEDLEGNSVTLTQTGCYLSTVGQMSIDLNDDGTISVETELLGVEEIYSVIGGSTDDDGNITLAGDTAVSEIETNWVDEITEQLGQKIAETDITFTIYDEDGNRLVREAETNLGDLDADAYYWYINEVASIDCDVAISNGGGVRAEIAAGDWTYLDAKTVNPFGNVLCVVEVSGQDILDALEFGARYTTADASGAENGGFLQVAGLTYKVDTSIENTVVTDDNSLWVSGPSEYRVYDVMIYNKETGEYEELDTDATYTMGGTNYTLRESGDGFTMFDDSYLVLDGISEDYMALSAYLMAFEDTDGNGYANVATETSPLYSYSGYLINYENAKGAGRIYIADGKDEESEDETSSEEVTTATDETQSTDETAAAGDTTTADETSASLGTTTTSEDDVKVARTKVKKAVKKSAKKVSLKLKKIAGATKYKVQISKKKKFTKKNIVVKKTVKSVKAVVTSKKLKNISKLYVRARAVAVVNGKAYKGKWSKVKKIK